MCVKIIGDIEEKETKKQRDSNERKEKFCLWRVWVLWQPLDTQGPMISLTSKPQRRSIMWGIHKRTRQGVSS